MRMIKIKCYNCGQIFFFEVPIDGFFKWFCKEEIIDVAMPDLTAEQRELLLSELCTDCWKSIFGE